MANAQEVKTLTLRTPSLALENKADAKKLNLK
jgi:hypothetical protein